MGGINHQPCSKYLEMSTRLSRAVSSVGVTLESFNISLEDAILINLGGHPADLNKIFASLQDLKSEALKVPEGFDGLSLLMSELYYVDLPAAASFDYAAFGANLCSLDMVQAKAYNTMAGRYATGGFVAALATMQEGFKVFIIKVDAMSAKIVSLQDEGVENIAEHFESNGAGNIRPEFAKVYTAWTNFHQCFLASSLISTEIYYRSESRGSLIDGKKELVSA